MQTGTIASLMPTMEQGYQSQNGYIYTFDISIQGQSGTVVGEIGSKSQTYPLNVGDQINFESKNSPRGVRITRINPGYAPPPQYQQPTGGPQTPQNRPPAPKPRDYDKENRGKCRFGFYKAELAGRSAVDLAKDINELAAIEHLIELSMNGHKTQPQTFNEFAEEADRADGIPNADDY